MKRLWVQIQLGIPWLAEASTMLFLTGLFFTVKAAQSSGWVGIVLAGMLALLTRRRTEQNRLWIVACLLMLLAGGWGMAVAPEPKVSWTAFWAYQTIGKGFLCALALSCISFSPMQLRRLLVFLLLMLIARNVEMLVYGYQHPVFLGGKELADQAILLGYRSQGDHILLLCPVVLAALLIWRKNLAIALVLLGANMFLLASTGWRGAWLGFAGSCLLLLIHFRAWRVLVSLLASATLVGLVGLLASADNIVAMAISRGFSDSERIDKVWLPVLEMLKQSNWQGYGFGQARYLEMISAYSSTRPELGIPVYGDAHNMILNFAMAAGWFGALAFVVVLMAGLGLCLWRLRDRNLHPEQTVLLSGIAAGWLGIYGLLGLTDQPHYNNLAVLAVLTSVVLTSSSREHKA